MGQQSNRPNQWPKAAVAILGTAAISAASYLSKEKEVMLAMIPLLIIVSFFD